MSLRDEVKVIVTDKADGASTGAWFQFSVMVFALISRGELYKVQVCHLPASITSASPHANAYLYIDFADCDHLPAAEDILRGVPRCTQPGFIIHTLGTKIIALEMENRPQTWGEFIPRRYDDWKKVRRLTAILSNISDNDDVHSAIACPPTVYGPSGFALFTRSTQLPRMLNVFLRLSWAFTIKGNQNKWNMIHTQDISEICVLLTEAAMNQHPGELWDNDGTILPSKGVLLWRSDQGDCPPWLQKGLLWLPGARRVVQSSS